MLSLYIHIPFCVGKCLYCGFYSTPYSPDKADEFISGLKLEAARYGDDFRARIFSSIYIGGGTPTVLTPGQFELVVRIIRDHFQLEDDVDFTVEANPNTVTQEKLVLLHESGVNRISLGVQSFSDEVLQTLGRIHTAEQAHLACRLARNSGFRNVSLDLIYGIPFQTMMQWEQSLDAVVAFKPEHVSAYSLSLDEGSPFYRDAEAGRLALPDDEITATMYEHGVLKLKNAGYRRYEISNFSLPGFECMHNMNYWERGEYLGLGPGAWSFISGGRYSNIADITQYSRSLSEGREAVDAYENVEAKTAARETLLLALRTMKGLDLKRFASEFGPDLLIHLKSNSEPLEKAGLLLVTEGRLRLTDRGILLSNEALARLFE